MRLLPVGYPSNTVLQTSCLGRDVVRLAEGTDTETTMPAAKSMKGATVDSCRYDDVNLDVGADQHLIECNHCGRWWRCYGDLRVVWSNFLRYECMNVGDP